MINIYLIRHGQTDWNVAGKIQGKTDIPLNETGGRQAVCLAKGMAKRPVVQIFSSDLLRWRRFRLLFRRNMKNGARIL